MVATLHRTRIGSRPFVGAIGGLVMILLVWLWERIFEPDE